MTIENKLRQYILNKYHSINDFGKRHDIPKTTLYSMFSRGIGNSSVSNVLKVCKALGISADALTEGRIEPNIERNQGKTIDLYDSINSLKAYISRGGKITVDGDIIDQSEIDSLVDSMEVIVEIAKKNHNRNHNKNHNKN